MNKRTFDRTNTQKSRNILSGEHNMRLINRLYKAEKDTTPLCKYCDSKSKKIGRKFRVTCGNWMCLKKSKSDNAKSRLNK